ncbi:hypothetical protein, conserved [Entamoeba dispar SAW760]|uniref:Rhodanese domain-containing protein n=1 Tax=Entamoeba dispar (strain ATCC PRA-260 / SAW760) TaxID=370354 RepID=B0EEV1_ENTDS|nr:uncharacterized protein EDI_051870 [Entamoeba dispar SAW760]EDR26950.1 hypothetical protein, conserved [Entamoeba dispar SAW760]|eukprot:EDR26950.1 hypothetical protein, conserved [Entamoeba dispar SAW760]
METPERAIEYMKEAINSIDVVLLRELCREFGIPDTLRLEIWKLFLQPKKEIVEEKTANNYVSKWIVEDNEILIEETNKIASSIHPIGTQPFFNCIVDVAAVVSKIFQQESIEIRCGITKSIIYKFHPFYKHLYPTIITGLQNLIHILLLYHDPILSIHLDTNRIEPTEYTNTFAFNLCINMCDSINLISKMWDEFITFPDTTLYIYCVVGYLIYLRKKILDAKDHQGVLNVINQPLKVSDIKTIIAYSKAIRLSTASSFNRILLGIMNNSELYQKVFSKSLTSSLFLTPLVNDIINDKFNRQFPYLFIDCRRQESFDLGTIAAAINLDYTKRQDDRNYLENLFKNELSILTQPNSTFHVVLFGDDDTVDGNPDIGELSMIGLDFAKRGVKRVSIMQEGFLKYHKNALTNMKGFQLMNHETETCPLCTTGKPLNFGLLEGTKKLKQTITQSTVEKTQQLTHGLIGFLYGSNTKKEEIKKEDQQPTSQNQNITNEEIKQTPPTQVENKEQLTSNNEEVNENMKDENNTNTEENIDDNSEEDDNYLKELIEESSKYNSYLNIGGKQTIWKPVVIVLTTISILIVEIHNNKIILLDDISYETISKVVMKKADPERFTIVHSGGKCTIRIPEYYQKFIEEISKLQG